MFEPPLGGLEAKYNVYLRLIGERVMGVLTELFFAI